MTTRDASSFATRSGSGKKLDTALLRSRRLELGLSQRELSRRAGTSQPTIRGLEDGVNQATVSLAVVAAAARTLGLTLDELAGQATPTHRASSTEPDSDTAADAAALGASLHAASRLTPTTVLAGSLGWSSARLPASATLLAEVVAPAGLRLVDRDGMLGLVASTAVPVAARSSVAQARYAQSGMSVTVARLLHRAVVGELDGSVVDPAGNADRVAAAELLNAALLRPDLGVAAEVKDALGWRS